MVRSIVKEIKIYVEINGSSKEYLINPHEVSALFFTDEAVKWMGAIYDINGKGILTANRAKSIFGDHKANKLLKGADQVKITGRLVDEIWNTPNESGAKPALLVKIPGCDVGGFP